MATFSDGALASSAAQMFLYDVGSCSRAANSHFSSSDGERFIASSTVEKPSKALPEPGLRLQSFSVGSGPSLSRSLIAEDSTALPAPFIEASTFMSQFTDQSEPLSIQTLSSFLMPMPALNWSLPLNAVRRLALSWTGIENSG